MPSNTRLIVRRAAARLNLLPTAFALYRWMHESTPRHLVADWRTRRDEARAGRPVPPGRLLYSISTSPSATHFVESGKAAAAALTLSLSEAGRPIDNLHDVLDFGCGCGRIMRFLDAAGAGAHRLRGTDRNRASIAWVKRYMPHVEANVNGDAPPLPYGTNSFDLVYAWSVFTHLPVALQDAWMAELTRVLRPGGVLVITTLGASYRDQLDAAERAVFDAGGCVVRDAALSGSNLCAAFHPFAYVRDRLAPGWKILNFAPAGARPGIRQDQYVLEAPRLG